MSFKSVIETVKPASRQAFVLHRFKGFTYEEIAEQMGISKTMVKKHICHVLLQFRKKMVQTHE
jgi:RNA polymerase sigma-70 factor (ECF subfamily)